MLKAYIYMYEYMSADEDIRLLTNPNDRSDLHLYAAS